MSARSTNTKMECRGELQAKWASASACTLETHTPERGEPRLPELALWLSFLDFLVAFRLGCLLATSGNVGFAFEPWFSKCV